MNEKDQLDPKLVQEFVGVAHGDLGRTRDLLSRHPALLNAAWDWGGGDWETALGAAAHTGQKEIAKLLLEKGARIDIFAAAMLDMVPVVQAIAAAHPAALNASGPHGIPLLVHAQMGKASRVLDYLQSVKT